jgi:hypothetical protein
MILRSAKNEDCQGIYNLHDIKPKMAKFGIGKQLLHHIEAMARKNNITELKLSATLNSAISSGINLDCIASGYHGACFTCACSEEA